MNQSQSEKKDRNGGGDVSKAKKVEVAETPKTNWDVLNHNGPGRFDPNGGDNA